MAFASSTGALPARFVAAEKEDLRPLYLLELRLSMKRNASIFITYRGNYPAHSYHYNH